MQPLKWDSVIAPLNSRGVRPNKPLKLPVAGFSQSFGFSSTRSW
jgi:hypothetical protein